MMVVDIVVMITWSAGPAVSLHGSPTVSPVTAALCASLPLPPCLPVSTSFFALSQAPPALSRKMAMSRPVREPNIMKQASTSGARFGVCLYTPTYLKTTPTATGKSSASSAGFVISLSAAFVTIATHVLYSGFCVFSRIPGNSLNCRRTSRTTSCAVSPTAAIAHPTNKKIMPMPSSPPTRTSTLDMLTTSKGRPENSDTSSR
mmetsp:Transcript_12780/g.26391  ORF Transcript_12780/g.26391 Transcript_12780/m.26391 type:complete len:203 (+) Transcript_12780:202-810(+)